MDPGVIAVFIPITAIILGIGIGMQALWNEHRRKAQILEQNHRERMHAIEKGIELPPLPAHLVGSGTAATPPSAAKSLRNGIMLTLIGVLLFIGIVAAGGDKGALFGLLPACVGIANLVYAAVQWKQEKEARGAK